jgi:hypothetical protein
LARQNFEGLAATSGMSLKTAETHRSNMKLNLHSTLELVLYAVRNDIFKIVHFSMVVPRVPLNGNRPAQIAV